MQIRSVLIIGAFLVGAVVVPIHASFMKKMMPMFRSVGGEKALSCYAEPQKAIMIYDVSLLDAASKGDVMQVSKLLLLGADPHRRDPVNGDTALHKAVKSKQTGDMYCSPIHTVHTLLFAGASAQCCNSAGKRPIDLASDYQMRTILLRTYPKRFHTKAC